MVLKATKEIQEIQEQQEVKALRELMAQTELMVRKEYKVFQGTMVRQIQQHKLKQNTKATQTQMLLQILKKLNYQIKAELIRATMQPIRNIAV